VTTYEGLDEQTGEVPSSVTRPTQDLLHAVLALSSNLDLATVLRRFVQTSADLTGARFAALNVLDSRGNSSTFIQVGMAPTVMEMLGRAPRSTGVLGQIPAHGVLRLDDLTQHPAFGGMPKGHPPLGSFLGASVRVREQVYGQLYLANKEPRFNSQDVEVVTALAAAAAVAIENAQLYAAGQRREHWLRAGQEITTMLLSGADEEDALERIAATAREVAEAATAVMILPGFGDTWIAEIVDGHGAEDLLGTNMPDHGRTRAVLEGDNGLLVDSLHNDPTLQLDVLRRFGPALYAPLNASGRTIGVLLLLRRIGSAPFEPADLATASSFAAQAALALVLAEARHAEDVSSLLDERERIARDLHDLAIQQLFATGMQLETVRRRAERGVDATELLSIVEDAVTNVDSSVRQIRSIVHALRDPDATANLVERLLRESSLARTGLGFAPTLLLDLDGRVVDIHEESSDDATAFCERISSDLADDVVAVVREGLANAARHARATSVAVRISVIGSGPRGEVIIEVEDDGGGLDAQRERRSGTDNLAARARRHGGVFTLGMSPSGHGTLLMWEAPLL